MKNHFQTGGTLNFGITSLADYGQITFAANPVLLTGTFSANFNGGYSPSVGDTFTPVSYTSRSGIFTNLVLPAAATWQTNYNASNFTVSVLSTNTGAGSVTLSPISNRTINPGFVLVITNTATDSVPADQITFSLTTSPTGAVIGASSGILQWRAPVARAGTLNPFTVMAVDNGLPPSSNSQSFSVQLNPLTPVILKPLSYATGQFTIQVTGGVGPDYTLLASTNINSSNWVIISSNTPGVLPFNVTDTNVVGVAHRYYRGLLGP